MDVMPSRKPTAASVWYFLKTAVPPKAARMHKSLELELAVHLVYTGCYGLSVCSPVATTRHMDQKAVKPSPAEAWAMIAKEHITIIKEKNCGAKAKVGGVYR